MHAGRKQPLAWAVPFLHVRLADSDVYTCPGHVAWAHTSAVEWLMLGPRSAACLPLCADSCLFRRNSSPLSISRASTSPLSCVMRAPFSIPSSSFADGRLACMLNPWELLARAALLQHRGRMALVDQGSPACGHYSY